jgi:O-antigen ligase
MQLWKDSWTLFLKRPLFGWGWFSSVDLITVGGVGEVPHNVYLQMLVETGLIGLLSYLFLIVFYSLYTYRIIKENGITTDLLCVLCTQTIFLAWSMTGNPVWDIYPFFLYLLTYPILRASKSRKRLEVSSQFLETQ